MSLEEHGLSNPSMTSQEADDVDDVAVVARQMAQLSRRQDNAGDTRTTYQDQDNKAYGDVGDDFDASAAIVGATLSPYAISEAMSAGGEPLSLTGADSDYDEYLAVPDSLSVISVAGDVPVLVEGKPIADNGSGADSVDNMAAAGVAGVENGENLQASYNNDATDHASDTYDSVPFSVVHQPAVKFKSIQRKVFIPDVEITVKIIDNERSVTAHMLNPNLYTIELRHGSFSWTVRKRYKHFQHLHQQLRLFRASLNIPFPTRSHRERRNSFRNNLNNHMIGVNSTSKQERPPGAAAATGLGVSDNSGRRRVPNSAASRRKGALPRFPNRPEALVSEERLPARMRQLEDYLYNLLNISFYRNHHETVGFLEVSHLSFVADLGSKGKEGVVQKRTGSTQPGQAGCNVCGLTQSAVCVRCNYFCTDVMCAKWRSRWFFAKDSCFGYIRPKDGAIRCVMLYDQGFEASTGMYSTGLRNGLQIINNDRQIVIKLWTRRQAKEWMTHLKRVANSEARDFTFPNPNSSFAPLRSSTLSHWYVDGAGYMSSVADAMEGAKEEIFIADWWLSPEIYMKRPALSGDYWRLDRILQRKAKQGVKIFVLLYKEVEMALGINSYYSKQRLVEDSDIKVLRHPDHARVGVFLWAHHEKIVCVDQTYAFLGGIDLCYGRWDDHKHRLTDLGSVSQPSTLESNGRLYSSGLKVRQNLNEDSKSTGDECQQKPLPVLQPGDKLLIGPPPTKNKSFCGYPGVDTLSNPVSLMVSPGSIVEGYRQSPQQPDCIKCNTPEMQRRNVLDKLKDNVQKKGKDLLQNMFHGPDQHGGNAVTPGADRDKNMFYGKHEYAEPKKPEDNDEQKRATSNQHDEFVSGLDGQAKLWMGKDYCNFIVKDFNNLDLPYVDLVDRSTTPRMPWHDIGLMVCGSAARDAARHFVQRWNAVKLEKARDNPLYPYLLPKAYDNITVDENYLGLKMHRVTCQVLRSVGSWSCGFLEPDNVEQSIHEAYVETITRAQHYVYIENQFFITLAFGNSAVKNQIGEALYKRIVRAHKERAVFRVYVVMPLLPAFEGEVGGASGTSLHAITHWNYASICRGKDSLLQRLKDSGIARTEQYISFHGLRTYSVLNGEPCTELIYVHSKLLISDDRVVICGSANINDRSMIGKRDSEIAVIIQDEQFTEGTMNGEVFPCGVYAGSLRKHLFKEHLGLLDSPHRSHHSLVDDATADGFWHDQWRGVSRDNTEVYERVFRCIPTDRVEAFQSLRKYQEEREREALVKTEPARALGVCMQSIQGNLVDFPLQFLVNEVLTPSGYSKEGMMPTSIWT